jgi:hypothetical protein
VNSRPGSGLYPGCHATSQGGAVLSLHGKNPVIELPMVNIDHFVCLADVLISGRTA